MTTREELIDEIYKIGYRVEYDGKESFDMGAVADFIIEDRRRICSHLKDISYWDGYNGNHIHPRAIEIINNVIRLSGLDENGEVKI